jgi:hypothetical protein
MRFLLRMTFWLGLIVILLPRGESQPAPNAQISASDAVTAATATVGDMRQFCERQPDACVVGSQAAVALEDRAKAGAKLLYDLFNEKLAGSETDKVVTATATKDSKAIPLPTARPSHAPQTASRSVAPSVPIAKAQTQNTLTPADLAPAWRAPPPRKDPHDA